MNNNRESIYTCEISNTATAQHMPLIT